MSKTILRSDAVALCLALGFKTAKSWNKQRMARKLKDLAEMVEDGSIEVDAEVEDAEHLNEVLSEIHEAGGDVEVVQEEKKASKKKPAPKKPAPKKKAKEEADEEEEEDEEEDEEEEEQEDEEEEEDEEEDEEEEEEEEDEVEVKPKKKPKKKKAKKGPSPFGSAVDLLCKDPDMDFDTLRKELQSKGVYSESSARTAFSSVRKVVKGLRANGLMK